ncbi:MAG: helix-hairpin-helix domain-containing protein [Draconibacterium sp.]
MKHFNNLIREYNRFSKSDRHSVIILAGLILFTFIATLLVPWFIPESEFDYSEYRDKVIQLNGQDADGTQGKALFRFNPNTISAGELDSLDLPENIKRNVINYRKAGGIFKKTQDFRKIYGMNDSIFAVISEYVVTNNSNSEERTEVGAVHEPKVKEDFFDPNNTEFSDLMEFGFNQFQAKNLVAYRSKGGIFKAPEDILKIYGIDSSFYLSIKSNIRIENSAENRTFPITGSLYIELNEADSAELVELNGIGPSFASRIIKYRNRLGGFFNPSQLLEVYNFPIETYAKIEGNIYVDTLKIQKIRINFADFKEFIKHPYFSKQKVELILKYREKNGSFENEDEIRASGIFDETEFKKTISYLTCR